MVRFILFTLVLLTINNIAIAQKDSTKVKHAVVEELPKFPGGEVALIKYIQNNLKYPNKARRKGVQGKVIINFIVDKEGNVTKAKVIRGISEECDKEALRVVEAMPKWEPGRQRGKAVRVMHNLPISFKLRKKAKK